MYILSKPRVSPRGVGVRWRHARMPQAQSEAPYVPSPGRFASEHQQDVALDSHSSFRC